MAEERPDYTRGVQVVLYSMNGGPIPPKAVAALTAEASKQAEAYHGLAFTVVEE